MSLPHKLATTFVSFRNDADLLDEVVPLFHKWVRSTVFEDVLVDVADYRHVSSGPGVILIGHECNYQLRVSDLGRLEVRCVQKRTYPGTRCPLAETFGRAVKMCRLLEEQTGRVALFDCTGVTVEARHRLTTEGSGFSNEEFAWHVRQSLSRELFTVPQVTTGHGGRFPYVNVRWVAERTFLGLEQGEYQGDAQMGVAAS